MSLLFRDAGIDFRQSSPTYLVSRPLGAGAGHTGFFWKFSFGNSNVGVNEFWCKIGLKTWELTSVH